MPSTEYVCHVSLHIGWKLDLPIQRNLTKKQPAVNSRSFHKVAIRIEWSKVPAIVVSYHATGVLSYCPKESHKHKVYGCYSCQFVFHVLQSLPIRLVDLQWCISKIWVKKQTNPNIVMVIRECMFVDFSTHCIEPPNCVHYWVCSSHKIRR